MVEIHVGRHSHHPFFGRRFAGRFRRVVSLPDDVDPNAIDAKYRDGVLHVRIQRKEEAQPRRITIQ